MVGQTAGACGGSAGRGATQTPHAPLEPSPLQVASRLANGALGVRLDGSRGSCQLSVRTRATRRTALFDQATPPVWKAADLVERVAVIAHEPAGLGDVAELLGQLQQRELAPVR